MHRENCEGSVEGIGAIQHLGQYPLGSRDTHFLSLSPACLMLITLGLVEMLNTVDLQLKFRLYLMVSLGLLPSQESLLRNF